MVRDRRVESDRSEWLALTAVMTDQRRAPEGRARSFTVSKFIATGRHDLLAIVKMPPPLPRLAQLGHGAVQRVVVGLFVHMLARYCQRGSRNRQTGAMV